MRVGMISTGPDREQTILVPEFVNQLGLETKKSPALRSVFAESFTLTSVPSSCVGSGFVVATTVFCESPVPNPAEIASAASVAGCAKLAAETLENVPSVLPG